MHVYLYSLDRLALRHALVPIIERLGGLGPVSRGSCGDDCYEHGYEVNAIGYDALRCNMRRSSMATITVMN